MARVRAIKPEFFNDEDIGALPPITRFLYSGLWCYADKAGRFEYRPAYLKAQILPYDNVDMVKELELLCSPKTRTGIPFILKYEVDGISYLQILQWTKHQYLHKTNEAESTLPEPPETALETVHNGRATIVQRLINGRTTEYEGIKNKNKKEERILLRVEEVVERWHKKMPWRLLAVTGERRRHLLERLEDKRFVDNFDVIMDKVLDNPFLLGKAPGVNHPHFKADFDWLIANPTNYVKVLEGKYDRKVASILDKFEVRKCR